MEAERSAFGDADMIARDDAGEERAGRQARPVDHDMLAGGPHRLVFADIRRYFAASVAGNARFRRSGAHLQQHAVAAQSQDMDDQQEPVTVGAAARRAGARR